MKELIDDFLSAPRFAVVGASSDREKYGNKVFRCYLQHGHEVVPINPRGGLIEEHEARQSLRELDRPETFAISVITPPAVTLKVLEEAHDLGIRRIWLQPGAESPAVATRAEELGLELIAGGPCLLVVLGFHA
ncbi:MAG: CoA-binding protein [Planctomycetes bacterium]|nr:CoA-binding protein [Planctomycetota bacterium]